ncbi:hypothetical protein Nepgr_005243 [Nepenthes gracilis]|uniref:Transmembrane protein n=1 Tax=Nepenthes gracilis TaxID=150966 RepID=A0AAD3XG34_NEPGR|nr:hypothetical protein Nepgr_005243 [Nepenthes gracilis]
MVVLRHWPSCNGGTDAMSSLLADCTLSGLRFGSCCRPMAACCGWYCLSVLHLRGIAWEPVVLGCISMLLCCCSVCWWMRTVFIEMQQVVVKLAG